MRNMKKAMIALAGCVLIFAVLFVNTKTAEANTIRKLPNGRYYYCDVMGFGRTNARIKNGYLVLEGEYCEYKKNGIGFTYRKYGKLKLKLKNNAKMIRRHEGGRKQKIRKKDFSKHVKNGCALEIKIKNNKVTRIDISEYTG